MSTRKRRKGGGEGQKEASRIVADAVPFCDLVQQPTETYSAVVEGLVYAQDVVLLGGSPKAGKTWVSMNLAFAVALGAPFLGRATTQGEVLYVNLELKPGDFRRRGRDILVANSENSKAAASFHVLNLRGDDYQIEALHDWFTARPTFRPSLVVLDPLYMSLGERNENDNSQMAELMKQFIKLARQFGFAIVIPSHYAKGDSSVKAAIDRISGAGAFTRACDASLTFTEHKEPLCFTFEAKLRAHPSPEPVVVEFRHPLFVQRDDLKAGDLKGKNRNRNEQKWKDEDLLSLLDPPLTTKQWMDAAISSLGMTRSSFHNYKDRLFLSKSIEMVKGTKLWIPS